MLRKMTIAFALPLAAMLAPASGVAPSVKVIKSGMHAVPGVNHDADRLAELNTQLAAKQ